METGLGAWLVSRKRVAETQELTERLMVQPYEIPVHNIIRTLFLSLSLSYHVYQPPLTLQQFMSERNPNVGHIRLVDICSIISHGDQTGDAPLPLGPGSM